MTAHDTDTSRQDPLGAEISRLDGALRELEALGDELRAAVATGDPDALALVMSRRDSAAKELVDAGSRVQPLVAAEPRLRDAWNALADRAAVARDSDARVIASLARHRDAAALELSKLAASKRAHGAYTPTSSTTPTLEDREA